MENQNPLSFYPFLLFLLSTLNSLTECIIELLDFLKSGQQEEEQIQMNCASDVKNHETSAKITASYIVIKKWLSQKKIVLFCCLLSMFIPTIVDRMDGKYNDEYNDGQISAFNLYLYSVLSSLCVCYFNVRFTFILSGIFSI